MTSGILPATDVSEPIIAGDPVLTPLLVVVLVFVNVEVLVLVLVDVEVEVLVLVLVTKGRNN